MPTVLPRPPATGHPVDVGLRTEAAILAELLKRGYNVLLPFGVNQRYDLVLDIGGKFIRVQCKTGRLEAGSVVFPTRSTRSNTRGWETRGYEGEAELFIVYCRQTGGIYVIPVREAPAQAMYLRVDPTRNGQRQRVRWAKDYELPA